MSHYQAQPQTAGNELLNTLRHEFLVHPLNEVALRRHEKSAQTLMKTDVQNAHLALALIAGIRHDSKKMREHFRVLDKLGKRQVDDINHATAELWCGNLIQAAQIMTDQAKQTPDDITIQRMALHMNLHTGHIQVASEMQEALRALLPNDREAQLNQSVENTLRVLASNEITETQLEAETQRAARIAAERGKVIMGMDYMADDDDSVLSIFYVRASLAECQEMGKALFEDAEHEGADVHLNIIVNYLPYKPQ